jgi:UDP-hydrolysing UDP-N-acetyl-D-glucosamine 2-epimerase
MAERKICVVTGTRAEYGLLYWLMRDIENDPSMTLQLIVTGTHLEPAFGHTIDVIEADGFRIDARVPIELKTDTPSSIARSTGLATAGIAEALETLSPDIVVLLGDRFEMLAAATAAMLTRNAIAHIHGGEATEGLIDEAIRHATSKMSHFHFAAAEAYRLRIIQMGEIPDHVFNTGAPGLDNIERLSLLDRDALGTEIGLDLASGYFLVTYHPVTLSHDRPENVINGLFTALDTYPERKIIFTGVNADPGNAVIDQLIKEYAMMNDSRVTFATSLGQVRYLSALKHCEAVIGNSSSGLIEAPSMGVPTVNIGDRQRGRLRASSVIDCSKNHGDILNALDKAMSDEHQALSKQTVNPYGQAGASSKICNHLKHVELENVLMKRFYDLPVTS